MRADPTARQVVLDANILIAVIRPDIGHVVRDEANACVDIVGAIDQGLVRGYISAPVLAEVMHVLARSGISERARAGLIARWEGMPGRLEIIPLDGHLAVAAGEFRQQHYHREQLPLSYIDCFCVSLARHLGIPIVTLDEPLLRAPGVTAVTPRQFLSP